MFLKKSFKHQKHHYTEFKNTLCGCEKKRIHQNKKKYKNNLVWNMDVQALNNQNATNRKP